MWTTDAPTFDHSHSFDKIIEVKHHFGKGVTVVSNFVEKTTKVLYNDIVAKEHDLIRDTEAYTCFLNNIANEINPIKE